MNLKNRKKVSRFFSLFLAAAMSLSGWSAAGSLHAEDLFTSGEAGEEENLYMAQASSLEEAAAPVFSAAGSLPAEEETFYGGTQNQNDIWTSGSEEDLFDAGEDQDDFGGEIGLLQSEASQDQSEKEDTGEAAEALTPEKIAQELAPFQNLTPILELPEPIEYDDNSITAMVGESFPAVYDQRASQVTPVKNQHPYGTCWAFATCSSMETSLLRAGEISSEADDAYDLSEEHIAYFLANRVNDPLGNTAGDKNLIKLTDYHEGGNQILATLFLSTWSGFAKESQVPYPTDETHSQVVSYSPDSSLAYVRTAYLKDAAYSSSVSTSRLKGLISQFGSVGVSLRFSETYLNPLTHAYSCPVSSSMNHAVTLVGWDDTYSHTNFLAASKVNTDGAWIVKNSWGEDWGDNGYCYISYECKNLANAVAVSGTTQEAYPNNYFYDGTVALLHNFSLTNASDGSEGTALANIFQVKAGNGLAEALGEVVVSDYSAGSSYGIQIYTNLTDLTDPTSGTPVYSTPLTYTKTYAGIGTFTLPGEVVLAQGSYFSVVLTNLGSHPISYMVEESGVSSPVWIEYHAQIDQGQSFALSGDTWKDLADNSMCARIKAHTRTLSEPVTLDLLQTSLSLTTGQTSSLATVIGGNMRQYTLSYTSSNEKVALVSKTGVITAGGAGTATVTCSVSGVPSLSASCKVKVTKMPAPADILVTPLAYNKIRIKWSGVAKADGYLVYRKVGKGKWKKFASVSGKKWVDDKSVILGKSYQYRVCAFKEVGTVSAAGKYSKTVSAKAAPLKAPTLKVSLLSTKRIKLKWKKVSGATGYRVYRREGKGSYSPIYSIRSAAVTTWTDKNVIIGKKYQYQIKAYRKVGSKNYYGNTGTSSSLTVK